MILYKKTKEFQDLKLGHMSIEDFVIEFVNPMGGEGNRS